ncbi:MAG TPA: metallopeptidase TldD-related protein [Candidatus Limnocylindrales bacterium]|nr:metallopeptidase TldD-related protein [Candidatus Limnocylindrales bacterium]
MPSLLGRDALLQPLRDALRDAPADEATLWAHRRRAAVTRYSRSEIHQSALSDEIHVRATAVVGRSVGVVTGNALDPASLRDLLAGAADLARLAPPSEEWPGVAGPGEAAPLRAYDEATAAVAAAEQADAIARVVAPVERARLRAAGTHHVDLTEDAVATSAGAAHYAPATVAYLRALVQSEVGSGYAEDLGSRVAALDPDGVAARAIDKCALDRDRLQLAPGEYEAVFEELAVAEILRVVSLTGLSAQAVREGRSFMSGRLGEQVTGERFTLHDDPLDPRTLGIPFDCEGTPKRRVTLVERGIARGPVHDRTTARAAGTRSTGHAADPGRYQTGGHAGNLTMAGGTSSRERLVGSVRRGVLITRFHYTNMPDPRRATMTGTSRDGTFLIEDGRITRALANVRYTMSALDLFAGIELLGPQRLARDWWSSNGMGSVVCLAPAMKVARAAITGSSPA